MFDLPPQNSYERLLAHKLADYYNLVHYSPPDSNSIRLCKTIGFKLSVQHPRRLFSADKYSQTFAVE